MLPLLLIFPITFIVLEGVWSSLFYTKRKEVTKKLSLVGGEKFQNVWVAYFIILSGLIFSASFLVLDRDCDFNSYVILASSIFVAYFLLSFFPSPTILGNILGF